MYIPCSQIVYIYIYIYMYVNIRRFVASAASAPPHLGLSERITLLPATSPMQSGFRNDFPTPPAHSDFIYFSFSTKLNEYIDNINQTLKGKDC